MNIKIIKPQDIEKRSFEIITEMLGDKILPKKYEHIIKRCIHTSADFEYADNLIFSNDADESLKRAFKNGCTIVTDTQMAKAGINKKNSSELGIDIQCFIADEDVVNEARERGITRAAVAVERAAKIPGQVVFAVGNAPTALIKIHEMYSEKKLNPAAVIAVPVGFVNVVESKELIEGLDIPYVIAKGRKGGSNIAAAICNAILLSAVNNKN